MWQISTRSAWGSAAYRGAPTGSTWMTEPPPSTIMVAWLTTVMRTEPADVGNSSTGRRAGCASAAATHTATSGADSSVLLMISSLGVRYRKSSGAYSLRNSRQMNQKCAPGTRRCSPTFKPTFFAVS